VGRMTGKPPSREKDGVRHKRGDPGTSRIVEFQTEKVSGRPPVALLLNSGQGGPALEGESCAPSAIRVPGIPRRVYIDIGEFGFETTDKGFMG
jgi:hypothetical protein